jgi:hypothetical protein
MQSAETLAAAKSAVRTGPMRRNKPETPAPETILIVTFSLSSGEALLKGS